MASKRRNGYCRHCVKNVPHVRHIKSKPIRLMDILTLGAARLFRIGPWYCVQCDRKSLIREMPRSTASDYKSSRVEQKETIAGQTVNFVDISGTFLDAPGGPFSGAPKIERKNYRMLAAIIQTKANGNYFVKLYGPKGTIDKNADHFKAMIKSLKIAD